MIRLLVYAFLAYLVYKWYCEKTAPGFLDSNILVSPDINEGLLTQPSQKYPVSVKLDSRVDRSNQPWYIGSNTFKGIMSDVKDLTGFDISSAQTRSYDVGAFWQDLNNRYGVH